MTVILVLLFFSLFLLIDHFMPHKPALPYRTSEQAEGTMITTPGFEALGALAQDGGEKVEETAKE